MPIMNLNKTAAGLRILPLLALSFVAALVACSPTEASAPTATAPAASPAPDLSAAVAALGAEVVAVDRFSDAAGTLHRRSQISSLPGPGEPVDFDSAFLNKGLGPDGRKVQYYDFDVQSIVAAPVYIMFYASNPDEQVPGQKTVFDVAPGEEGYNDFWQVIKVLVPDDFVADSLRSLADIEQAGYEQVPTNLIVNCPLVPLGSTARHASNTALGWYDGKAVQYFTFEMTELTTMPTGPAQVPYAVIRVMFSDNDMTHGFALERNSDQTHNVVDSVPSDELYRALWRVEPIDAAAFDDVSDWDSTKDVPKLPGDWPLVNCPVVVY